MKDAIKQRIEQIRRGEMPKGYQKYGPYTIPQDWRVVKLGEVSECLSRPNRDGKERPVYSISNQKGFIPQNEQFEEGSYQDLDKSAYKIVRQGEFAYNPARINVGSIGRLKDEAEAIISSLYVCVKMNESVDGDFFEKWLKTSDFYKEIIRNTEGSVRDYLFYENFSNIRMPLPSISEQQKIAKILSECDQVIELKQKLVGELKKLKKVFLAKMFPQEREKVPENRFPGFTAPWGHRTLASLCKLFIDGDWIESKDQSDSGIRLIQTGNIGVGEFLDKPDNRKWISYETFHRLHCNEVLPGDILISRLPDPAGRACIIPYLGAKMITAVDCTIIRTASNVNNNFLIQYLSTKEYFDAVNTCLAGGTRQRISRSNLAKLCVPIPSEREEQGVIGSYFSTIDTLISLHQRELENEQRKKKVLMQLLLTGIVRVR